MRQVLLTALLLMTSAVAQAQGGAAEFPPSSITATAQELNSHLSGKTFRAKYANGTPVQTKFSADGGLAARAPGFYDTGKWKAEDGRLCGSLRKSGDFCNDARFDAGVLYLRRMNGEIIRYDPE